MPTLTIVVGMGGSGKSTFCDQQQEDARKAGRDLHVFKDGTLTSTDERRAGLGCLGEMVARLMGRREDCIMDESHLTVPGFREAFAKFCREFMPDVRLEWVFFKADVRGCINNLYHDAVKSPPEQRRSGLDRFRAVDGQRTIYRVPSKIECPGRRIMPVPPAGTPHFASEEAAVQWLLSEIERLRPSTPSVNARAQHGAQEMERLRLLREVQQVLANALNSLGGGMPATVEASYLGWAAVSVNRAAAGCLSLRDAGRVAASKLLVRPALEAVFAGVASVKKRGFLFRKAYSEWEKDKKLFAKAAAGEQEAAKALEDLKHAFQQESPGCPLECKRVSVRETAELAGFLDVYEGAYRLYCQFTHGAMRAVLGTLDTTDTMDTSIVSWCVLQMLDHLKERTPAEMPELVPFKQRLIYPHRERQAVEHDGASESSPHSQSP